MCPVSADRILGPSWMKAKGKESLAHTTLSQLILGSPSASNRAG